MSIPSTIHAVTFDCFGTLIDWNKGIGHDLSAWAAKNGIGEATDPLVRQFGEFQRRHQVMRPFKAYRIVLRDAFRDLADVYGVDGADADADAFAARVATWPAFPDTVAGLTQLKPLATLGIMSNVDDDSIARVHEDHLAGSMDEIVTADDIEAYKPDHAHFDAMRQRLAERGIEPSAWLHVAQSRFHDIAPCRDLDIACVWLDRIGACPEHGMTVFGADAEPDATVYDMTAVVSLVAQGDERTPPPRR